jgi:two-component system, chemotaxis family, CheB/CheR fusion protein
MTVRRAPQPGRARPQPNGRALAKPASVDFPVVALGASAGGLDAFKKLFDALPANTGMAFVLIQHLDPAHESLMVDLLAGHTPMKVLQATDRMLLARDRVYLIPPGVYLAIEGAALRLSKPMERHGARMPFDFFLRSLAEECGERAICAILSGTGTDGSLGLKAVKEQGGLVIVQDPEEAAFDGMPRSAILSGGADLVLTLAKIAQALVRYGRQTYLKVGSTDVRSSNTIEEAFPRIIDLLAARTPHDFSLYKQGTLQRRIERRMAMAGIESGGDYLQVLREDPGERELLAKDLLINVTHFFRDPAAFDLLGDKIIPELVQRQTLDRPLRIWVPGCSTGDEVYSLGMLFLEQIAVAKRNIKLQVFASDIDADCVAFARNGIYPESIEADVALTRLARFFIKEDHYYHVVRELREIVVFTNQSLLADAPFSRLDLISCRNLLIYLGPEAQRKILSLFHFALHEDGVLFLGSSETVGNLSDCFEPISKQHRIYRHIGRSRPGEVEFPRGTNAVGRFLANSLPQQTMPRRLGFAELSQRALLEAYAPASVLINAKHEGLYYFGSMDRYLKVVSGEGTRDVLAMAREGLRAKLRSAIEGAKQDHTRVAVTGAHLKRDGCAVGVSIIALPVKRNNEELFLVSFLDDLTPELTPVRPAEPAADTSRIAQLEQELTATREDLESAIRDLEMTNEEQKAVNEEAMSVNEEYQSTNEELETSKEELQSLNEELTALNIQLHETVEQQRAASNDLRNILNSTDVATLFLDADLNIRFFTPAVKSLFNVIASDVGRPLADLTRRFKDDDLVPDARAVLASHVPIRREVEADDHSWFMRGMLPYRSEDGQVEGLVITFAGISEIKAAEQEIETARAYLDSIIATIRQPLVVLDEDLRVISASSSFHRVFSIKPEVLTGRHLLAAGDHLDMPALRDFLASIHTRGTTIDDHEVEIELPSLGRRTFLMSARVLREEPSAKRKILVAVVDVTEMKREGKALEAAKSDAERANVGKSRFLAAASHDLRQPLQTISLLQGMLEKRVRNNATLKLVHRLEETVRSMSSLLDKLLDINQLEAGIVRPSIVDFPILRLLEEMRTEFAYHTATNALGWRVVPSRLTVRSDPRLLEQIIRNLVSNAVKYTTRGKLLLGCRRCGDRLRIEVWDTGPGIPELELQAIFEEFHQLDNPARERSKGLGLGLAIVQRLADLLGHKIDVRSRVGAGSVFTIEVPLGRPEAADLPVPGKDEIAESIPSRGTILIVEDDPAVLEMLQLLFDDEGHRTLVAADGYTALGLAAEGSVVPDLIVADYNLPKGFNGLETIVTLQKQVQRTVPAIILTGDTSTESLREIASHGYAHLAKPVRAKELTRLIQRLLAKPASSAPHGVQQLPLSLEGGEASHVFVVDDDRAVREAMGDLLQENGYSVELFADGSAFLQAHYPGRKGCLLVDALMPGMSGVELIERLKAAGRQLPAIVITGSGAVSIAVQAMKAGAVDFIEKPVGHDELLASVKRALEHTRDTAALSARRETAAMRLAALTARQRQILDLVLAGHPSKNIAADLGISQRTVDNHRAAIMRKTGSKSIPALIRTVLAAPDQYLGRFCK